VPLCPGQFIALHFALLGPEKKGARFDLQMLAASLAVSHSRVCGTLFRISLAVSADIDGV